MSPLHLDYRPTTLKEFEGNRTTVESLSTVMSREKDIPHAFLFTGSSGCGKTTLGRIIKNMLGCSDADYKEMDSASVRGIDTIREIRNHTRLKPMSGKVRVWLLDECHKLTNDAQNALLKILEDTPTHVYFILCTTDPEKLLKTIKSRCMQFTVGPLSEKQMTRLLTKITQKEGIDFPQEAYSYIHQNSLGHVRSALLILDKVIDLPASSIMKAIEQAQGDEAQVIELCRALLDKKKWNMVAQILRGVQETTEPESVRHAVLGYMNSVLLKTDKAQAAQVIECFKNNFFDSGKAGLTQACYDSINL